MKMKRMLLAILAIVFAATIGVVGCDNGSTGDNGNNPKPITFKSTDAANNTYTLIITPVEANAIGAGDSYVLTITNPGQPDKVSNGTITNVAGNGALTMQPKNSGSITFTVTVTNSGQMTDISGTITVGDGEGQTITAPGQVTPGEVGGGDGAVTLNSVTANGSSTQTTTQLTLVFSQAITGLSANDISLTGVSGVSKGTLSNSGTSYTLPISGFTAGGTLNVAVSKTGYTISGSPKTVTIYYSGGGGNASDFTYTETVNAVTITGYIGAGGNVTIPAQINGKPVTSIGYNAFSNKTSITSVTIPNSVISIAWGAFSGCTGLTSIIIPDSVTSIEWGAFSGTAWFNNQPDGLVYAGKVAYKYKGNMPANTSITLLDGTKGIAEQAFFECTNLTSITIPNSVINIGYAAFSSCANLTSITIPNSVTSIGWAAFSFCTNLPAITVEAGNTAYTVENGVLYNKNKTVLHTYPAGKTGTMFIIPDSVTSIGDRAFQSCTSLTSVTIGNSVTSIGDRAFQSCTSLTGITFPISVNSIRGLAFYGCTNLASVTFQGTIAADNLGDSQLGSPFDGDLRDKYLAGGIGTYTTTVPVNYYSVWTKQGSSGGGEAGTFTLTGIPSQYNGKYAILMASNLPIGGAQNINIATDTITLVPISSGSVSLPMWKDINTDIWSRYSGNDTAAIVSVVISSLATSSLEFDDTFYSAMAANITFNSVAFSNGSATRSWSQGQVQTP